MTSAEIAIANNRALGLKPGAIAKRLHRNETMLVANIRYEKDGKLKSLTEVVIEFDLKHPKSQQYESKEYKAGKLGYTRAVNEFKPRPISDFKRKEALNSRTFLADPRNTAGVGCLHRSRISTKVKPLDPKYCNPDGSFAQEW